MKLALQKPIVRPAITSVISVTAPLQMTGLKNIAFVHVDCDQYVSTLMAILFMQDRLVKGGMLYFDDYTTLLGARNAIDESYNPDIYDADETENGKRVFIKK